MLFLGNSRPNDPSGHAPPALIGAAPLKKWVEVFFAFPVWGGPVAYPVGGGPLAYPGGGGPGSLGLEIGDSAMVSGPWAGNW